MKSNNQPNEEAVGDDGDCLAGEPGSGEIQPLLIKRAVRPDPAQDESEYFKNDEFMFDEMRLDTHRNYNISLPLIQKCHPNQDVLRADISIIGPDRYHFNDFIKMGKDPGRPEPHNKSDQKSPGVATPHSQGAAVNSTGKTDRTKPNTNEPGSLSHFKHHGDEFQLSSESTPLFNRPQILSAHHPASGSHGSLHNVQPLNGMGNSMQGSSLQEIPNEQEEVDMQAETPRQEQPTQGLNFTHKLQADQFRKNVQSQNRHAHNKIYLESNKIQNLIGSGQNKAIPTVIIETESEDQGTFAGHRSTHKIGMPGSNSHLALDKSSNPQMDSSPRGNVQAESQSNAGVHSKDTEKLLDRDHLKIADSKEEVKDEDDPNKLPDIVFEDNETEGAHSASKRSSRQSRPSNIVIPQGNFLNAQVEPQNSPTDSVNTVNFQDRVERLTLVRRQRDEEDKRKKSQDSLAGMIARMKKVQEAGEDADYSFASSCESDLNDGRTKKTRMYKKKLKKTVFSLFQTDRDRQIQKIRDQKNQKEVLTSIDRITHGINILFIGYTYYEDFKCFAKFNPRQNKLYLKGSAKKSNAKCGVLLKQLSETVNLKNLKGIMLGPQSCTFQHLINIGRITDQQANAYAWQYVTLFSSSRSYDFIIKERAMMLDFVVAVSECSFRINPSFLRFQDKHVLNMHFIKARLQKIAYHYGLTLGQLFKKLIIEAIIHLPQETQEEKDLKRKGLLRMLPQIRNTPIINMIDLEPLNDILEEGDEIAMDEDDGSPSNRHMSSNDRRDFHNSSPNDLQRQNSEKSNSTPQRSRAATGRLSQISIPIQNGEQDENDKKRNHIKDQLANILSSSIRVMRRATSVKPGVLGGLKKQQQPVGFNIHLQGSLARPLESPGIVNTGIPCRDTSSTMIKHGQTFQERDTSPLLRRKSSDKRIIPTQKISPVEYQDDEADEVDPALQSPIYRKNREVAQKSWDNLTNRVNNGQAGSKDKTKNLDAYIEDSIKEFTKLFNLTKKNSIFKCHGWSAEFKQKVDKFFDKHLEKKMTTANKISNLNSKLDYLNDLVSHYRQNCNQENELFKGIRIYLMDKYPHMKRSNEDRIRVEKSITLLEKEFENAKAKKNMREAARLKHELLQSTNKDFAFQDSGDELDL